ncbi:SDR family NAD(P)-dependent oxidoreductase, partial [Myxococcus fulvus]|uniref:SDR family NAD(P)-dependent oxidoreductase n=1 Tax=Myxococcus fulvus TaxID=33 RepID=UPI003B9BECA4
MREGANVLLFGRTQSSLDATADELNRILEGRARAVPFAGDVTQATDVARGLEFAERELGLPGILVNNAGTVTMSLLVDMEEDNFDQVMTVNLKGPFLFMKAFARTLLQAKKPGAVVNISSLAQLGVTEGMAHYCASKAGLAHLSKVAALEFGGHGIRVNVVAPGVILTPLVENAGFVERMHRE